MKKACVLFTALLLACALQVHAEEAVPETPANTATADEQPQPDGRREGKKGRAEKGSAKYDPGMPVYADALWYRVHAEDCPQLLLKEFKKPMTLAEADEAGYRIGGEGRSVCCLKGYKRKHPQKEITEDTIVCGNDHPKRWKHLAGCHRYWPQRDHMRKPLREWLADGCSLCGHCLDRGPSSATITDEAWQTLPGPRTYVPPEGWMPEVFSLDSFPSAEQLEVLKQEILSAANGIQELPFSDPVARMENFVNMRFFFPVHSWLAFYMGYRATGDDRFHDKLLESARHYHQLSVEFPSVAQYKARDPEGLAFMYSMAACSRITMQKARKYPGQVSEKELVEAEAFLRTMVSVLKPILEGDGNLDPDMGIPQPLADDYRKRAFNRAMNGNGTLAMIMAALEDLQALRNTTEYQASIDRYRKALREYLKFWIASSDLNEFDGKTHFFYPYKPEGDATRIVDGAKVFKRAEDHGHYGHTLQGLWVLFESEPELGVDEPFMTAVANALYFHATTPISPRKFVSGGRVPGYVQSPTQMRVDLKNDDKKEHNPDSYRFYYLQAFRDDFITGLNSAMDEAARIEANKKANNRLATLFSQYVKALRQDRSLIHLGEVK